MSDWLSWQDSGVIPTEDGAVRRRGSITLVMSQKSGSQEVVVLQIFRVLYRKNPLDSLSLPVTYIPVKSSHQPKMGLVWDVRRVARVKRSRAAGGLRLYRVRKELVPLRDFGL